MYYIYIHLKCHKAGFKLLSIVIFILKKLKGQKQFIICSLVFIVSAALLLFLYFPVSLWYYFSLARRTSFSISSRTDLFGNKYLVFSDVKIPLFHHHSWAVFLLDIEFCVDTSVSFNTLKILFHCPLSSMISDEKSLIIWVILPYMVFYYSLLSRFFFSSFGLKRLDYEVFGHGFHWVYPFVVGWASIHSVKFIYFFKFGSFQSLFLLHFSVSVSHLLGLQWHKCYTFWCFPTCL